MTTSLVSKERSRTYLDNKMIRVWTLFLYISYVVLYILYAESRGSSLDRFQSAQAAAGGSTAPRPPERRASLASLPEAPSIQSSDKPVALTTHHHKSEDTLHSPPTSIADFTGKYTQSSRNMPYMSGRLLLMSGRGLQHCRTFCLTGVNTGKLSSKWN